VRNRLVIGSVLAVQSACAFFFVSDILTSVLGLEVQPLAWELRELLEIGASLGLILGVFSGALMLTATIRSRNLA
jgi:hypothetical protein